MTLDKLLQAQGFGTRKESQRMIIDGRVSVSGVVVTDFQRHIEPELLSI